MSGSLSKSLHSSSYLIKMRNMEQEAKAVTPEKQGIGTILGSDSERSKAASLRRTLSADMSSKKWLAQNGFSPMKKIASSEELSLSQDQDHSSSSSSEGEGDEQDRRLQKKNNEAAQRLQGQFDIWTSIVAPKANKDDQDVPEGPYVHPLLKKQASSLTEKSLEVCTESLGSETGSEVFSSYPPSETSDVEGVDKEEDEAELQPQTQTQTVDEEEVRVVKYYSAVAAKKLPPVRSFPPPLPSLSGTEGASLRMRTHRDNGRLVLEAVSMPSPNNFRAQRRDGRLVLTFLTTATSPSDEEVVRGEENKEVELEENFVNFGAGEDEKESEKSDDDDEEDEKEEEEKGEVVKESKENGIKEIEIGMEEAPRITSRVTNVHRLALMMNRPIGLANRTSTHGWGNKFNPVVKYGGDDEEEEVMEVVEQPATLAQSLPPRPGRVARLIPKLPAAVTKATAAAASLNAYEYYWRAKPTATSALNPTSSPPLKSNNLMSKNQKENHEQQQLLVLRGNKGDYLGCKEPRRSLLFWEPYCIATS